MSLLHTTGNYHIDAVAIGGAGDAVALATSSLTGDVWDGRVVLLHGAAAGAAAVPAGEIATAAGVADVAWVAPDTLATGDDRGNVSLWQPLADPAGATPILTLGEHSAPITAVAASPVRSRLASTSLDGTARVWAAVQAGGATHTLEHLHQNSWCDVQAHAAAWMDPSAELLATAASDGVARLWDLRAAKPAAARLAAQSAPLLCIVAGAADSQLLVGGECGRVMLFDTRKPSAPVASAQVHADAVTALGRAPAAAVAPALLAAGCEDGGLALLDARDLAPRGALGRHPDAVRALAWLQAPTVQASGALLSGGWDKQLLRHAVGAGGQLA